MKSKRREQTGGTQSLTQAPRRAVILAVSAVAAAAGAWVLWQNRPTFEPPVAGRGDRLVVSDNQRFLQHGDGRPFFYLGDTAWELFHRLNREEAELYLEDRRAKGFNVIQAVALSELGGTTVPNAYGHLPLIDRDPARPDVREGAGNDYWDNVDDVIELAGAKGMYVGLLPTWGDKVEKLHGVDGDPVFNPRNARAYGRFLGERYRETPNVIWILGGDRGPNQADVAIWRAMADGLREGDGGAHLLTYHPYGGRSSSTLLAADARFDFNMVQSGHCDSYADAVALIEADYAQAPTKPTIDAEPRYEDHPKCFDAARGRWDEHDARALAYLQTFAGAFGHTYGNHNIWQFWQPGREPVTDAGTPWREAMADAGAAQMQHVRRLLESRPFLSRIPDQGMVAGGSGDGAGLVRATRDADGAYAMVYAAEGDAFTADLTSLSGTTIRAWWYDPRTGDASDPWEFARPDAGMQFDPPGTPDRANDWVLVLDDAARDFGPPGAPPAG